METLVCTYPEQNAVIALIIHYRHGIKERKQHGTAGSVSIEDVEAECIQVREEVAPYAPKNCFNLDKNGIFPFIPPDCGLATLALSGKKQNKTWFTLALVCNADGSKKLPPVFIGKAKCPQCFGWLEPNKRGFYYWSNKTAWMITTIFDK
jgi:hypothetical protein